MRAVGLPELITTSLADYEALALRLATAPDLLAKTKAELGARLPTALLFDTDGFRRHIETAYTAMVEHWLSGAPPTRIDVRP